MSVSSPPAPSLSPQQSLTAALTGSREWPQWISLTIAIVIFCLFSTTAAIYSRGFLEADGCTHFLYSRFVWQEHHLITNVWGRPFCTAIYAIPALFHRQGVRSASMIMAVAICLLTFRVAKRQNYRLPVLAGIFLLGQPILFLHSFSELTEIPFALLVTIALWAYQTRRFLLLAIIVALMPTARPEGFGFIALATVAFIFHRRAYLIPILILPLALWSFAGWAQFGMVQPWHIKWWRWLPENWPYAMDSLYHRRHLLYFIGILPAVISPFVFPFMWIGVWRNLKSKIAKLPLLERIKTNLFGPDHLQRVQWLIALIPLMIMAGHSYLAWRGKMASNAEPRYLLVAAPMWALLTAKGWEWTFSRLHWKSAVAWAGIAVLLPGLANAVYKVVPLKLNKEGMRAQEVSDWYKSSPYYRADSPYPRLISTAKDVYYFLDLSDTDKLRTAEWQRKTILNDYRGIILVWDPVYGLFNSDVNRSMKAQEIRDAGWIPIQIFDKQYSEPPKKESIIDRVAKQIQDEKLGPTIIFLSPQDSHGNPTPRSLAITLPDMTSLASPATQPATAPSPQ
ncbi:MAG TPA: hypothetical protein VGQ99_05740 [Tepidisphaeraceae bacterium]|jgi:hypothetical protein|nr:hypothetical protein [Tepidisphaeraceae bacterium]